jgi:hypothetical protein
MHALQTGTRTTLERFGRAARKRQQQHSLRIGAVGDQVRRAARQRARLARSRAGNDQQRPTGKSSGCNAVLDGEALLAVERCKVIRCGGRQVRWVAWHVERVRTIVRSSIAWDPVDFGVTDVDSAAAGGKSTLLV